jgi:putative hydrolase of HD superfamily
MFDQLVDLLFECQHLKDKKHEWVRKAGVQSPPSIAAHSLCAAQIGYVLARLEWADAHKVVTILVWHDLAETRIWDIDKVGQRYIANKKEVEHTVLSEQLSISEYLTELADLYDEYESKSSLEWKIAKDADYLEQAFQAKIYVDSGYVAAQNWIDNVGDALRTESAQQLFDCMISKNFTDRRYANGLQDLSWV